MRASYWFVTWLLCAWPHVVHAEPAATQNVDARSEARRYFQAGVALQKTDDFEAASEAYATSLEYFPTKSALFNLANCQRAMHRYADAWRSLHRLHEEFGAELEEPMLSNSKTQLEELETLTGLLTVNTEPVGANVSIDGKAQGVTPLAAPLRLEIGQHTITVTREGYTSKESVFKLSPKQSLTLSLELAEPPPPEPEVPELPPETTQAPVAPKTTPAKLGVESHSSAWRTVGWVGITAGAVGVALGARNGVLALQVDDKLSRACEGVHCARQQAGRIERLDRLALSANVFIGAGAVLMATGAALVLWPSSSETTEQVTVSLGFDGLNVGGRF